MLRGRLTTLPTITTSGRTFPPALPVCIPPPLYTISTTLTNTYSPPALRFSTAHLFNNYYKDVFAQAVHTRSGAQALVEYNVFRNVTEAISTYGKVIPQDSPNTSPDGDYEPDGFANERCELVSVVLCVFCVCVLC